MTDGQLNVGEPEIALGNLTRDIGSAARRIRRQIRRAQLRHPTRNNVRIDRVQPIRSAITVDGIVGTACSNSRILGSTASTHRPGAVARYRGGPSDANAARTVFFEIPNTRAITLIGIRSARCNRRISAQSSTDNTPCPPPARCEPECRAGGQNSAAAQGQFSRAVDAIRSGSGFCTSSHCPVDYWARQWAWSLQAGGRDGAAVVGIRRRR